MCPYSVCVEAAEVIETLQKEVERLKQINLHIHVSPVTENPQEDAFYEKLEAKRIKQAMHHVVPAVQLCAGAADKMDGKYPTVESEMAKHRTRQERLQILNALDEVELKTKRAAVRLERAISDSEFTAALQDICLLNLERERLIGELKIQ